MSKQLFFTAISVSALLLSTQLAQAASCPEADWCLTDTYGIEDETNSGTQFYLYLDETETSGGALQGSIDGFALIPKSLYGGEVDDPDVVCPVDGAYVEDGPVAGEESQVWVNVGLHVSCLCQDGFNPSTRTFYLRVEETNIRDLKGDQPSLEGNLFSLGQRCTGSTDPLGGATIGGSAITPTTTPTTTPEIINVIEVAPID